MRSGHSQRGQITEVRSQTARSGHRRWRQTNYCEVILQRDQITDHEIRSPTLSEVRHRHWGHITRSDHRHWGQITVMSDHSEVRSQRGQITVQWDHNAVRAQWGEITVRWDHSEVRSQWGEITVKWDHSEVRSQWGEITVRWDHSEVRSQWGKTTCRWGEGAKRRWRESRLKRRGRPKIVSR